MTVTVDLSAFGYREIKLAQELLKKWVDDKLTPVARDQDLRGLQLGFNTHSGYVFLHDEEYTSLMPNHHLEDSPLDVWWVLPYSGTDGFIQDLRAADLEHAEDREYLADLEAMYGA